MGIFGKNSEIKENKNRCYVFFICFASSYPQLFSANRILLKTLTYSSKYSDIAKVFTN